MLNSRAPNNLLKVGEERGEEVAVVEEVEAVALHHRQLARLLCLEPAQLLDVRLPAGAEEKKPGCRANETSEESV